jgi:hypothetical protein
VILLLGTTLIAVAIGTWRLNRMDLP